MQLTRGTQLRDWLITSQLDSPRSLVNQQETHRKILKANAAAKTPAGFVHSGQNLFLSPVLQTNLVLASELWPVVSKAHSHRTRSTSQHDHANYGTHCGQCMGVFTQLASNIKGFVCKFGCNCASASCVNGPNKAAHFRDGHSDARARGVILCLTERKEVTIQVGPV